MRSGVNAGGVRQLRRHPAEVPLSVAAMDRWLNLDAFLGHDLAPMCEFTGHVGQVAVAETKAEMAGPGRARGGIARAGLDA